MSAAGTFLTPARLRRGHAFTYIGAFEVLVAVTDAKPDPSFPGRIRLRAVTVDDTRCRQVCKDVRLRAEQPCFVVSVLEPDEVDLRAVCAADLTRQ